MVDPAVAEAFVANPGAWADPALAAPLIAPGLRADTMQRLLASPRLAQRASRFLADRLGWGDTATLEPADLSLAIAAGATLQAVALQAGAIWHARRLRSLVLGADIELLGARLGDTTRSMALRHVALAPDTDHVAGVVTDDTGTLADDIERDGAWCMAAWIDTLPDWAAARVRLKWHGPSASPAPAAFASPAPAASASPAGEQQRASAARIIRALAAEACAV
jgi:hypothetical protein